MYTRSVRQLAILGGLLALCGCMEDTITNQNEIIPPGGAIYGRIRPVEAGTEAAAWQAVKVKSVTADAAGYFSIADLEPGLYKLVVTAPSGARRTIPNLAVDRTQSVAVGTVELVDLPEPFLDYSPSDADSNASAGSQIWLRSSEELDLDSFATAVRVTPPVAGTWVSQYYGDEIYSYSFQHSGLELGTTYHVQIDPSLRLASGVTWGRTLQYGFKTEGFSLVGVEWSRTPVSVSPLSTERLCSLRFNASVDPSSLATGIRLEPATPITATVSYYSSQHVEIRSPGGFTPGTAYAIRLDENLRDLNGHALMEPEPVLFQTEAFKVIEASFTNPNSSTIEPGGDLNATVRLNSRVDVEAFNDATSFDPPLQGFWVEAQSSGDGMLQFFATASLDLVPEQAYSLRIVGSAPLANGQSLGTDFVAGFVVQPVRVRSVYPTNASTNVPLSQNINIEFNTPMESISTVRAVVLRPLGGAPVGIDVSWYSENRSLSLSATRGLEPSTSYELSVSTEARDQRGHAPRSAWRIVFRTRQY